MYFDITLSYGRKSGYGSYGPPEGVQPGAKILQLYLNEKMDKIDRWMTYILNEDGTKVDMFE